MDWLVFSKLSDWSSNTSSLQKYLGIHCQTKPSAEKNSEYIPSSIKGLNLIVKANFESKKARTSKVFLPWDLFNWEPSRSFHNYI